MAALLVRAMSLTDLDAVIDIEARCYAFPWTRGHFTDSIAAGYTAVCLEVEGRVRGYAVLMRVLDEAHLLNICVAPEFQGRSWGRFLMEWCMTFLRGQLCSGLLLEVRPSNTAARALYEHMGFRLVGTRKGYYPALIGREDALVLFKTLDDAQSEAVP